MLDFTLIESTADMTTDIAQKKSKSVWNKRRVYFGLLNEKVISSGGKKSTAVVLLLGEPESNLSHQPLRYCYSK